MSRAVAQCSPGQPLPELFAEPWVSKSSAHSVLDLAFALVRLPFKFSMPTSPGHGRMIPVLPGGGCLAEANPWGPIMLVIRVLTASLV